MLYAILCEDHENSLQKRLQTRPVHLERLQQTSTTRKNDPRWPSPLN